MPRSRYGEYHHLGHCPESIADPVEHRNNIWLQQAYKMSDDGQELEGGDGDWPISSRQRGDATKPEQHEQVDDKDRRLESIRHWRNQDGYRDGSQDAEREDQRRQALWAAAADQSIAAAGCGQEEEGQQDHRILPTLGLASLVDNSPYATAAKGALVPRARWVQGQVGPKLVGVAPMEAAIRPYSA